MTLLQLPPEMKLERWATYQGLCLIYVQCLFEEVSEFFQESSKPENSIKLAIKKDTIKEVSFIFELSVFDKTKAECEN